MQRQARWWPWRPNKPGGVAAATAKRRPRRLSLARREALTGYALISPWIIGFIVFTAGPLLGSLWLSFQRYGLLSPPVPVGLKNYIDGVTSAHFAKSLKVTAEFGLVAVPIGVMGSLFCAILLNQKVRGIVVYRTLFFLPSIVSAVAATLMWVSVLQNRFGLLNFWLRNLGIDHPPTWLASTTWALPALIIIATWTIGGPNAIIFLSALQSIPQEYYEAARIDGASGWATWRHITLPMLTPTVFFMTILSIIWVFAQGSFTMAYLATGGGPNYATYFYSLYVYQTAFSFSRLGLASALAWMLFAALILLTFVYFKAGKFWVYYAGESD